MFRFVFGFMVLATSADAGPWPRGAGQHFLSLGIEADRATGTLGGDVYHEWGLTDRTTLVFSGSQTQGAAPRVSLDIARDIWPGRDWRYGWSIGAGLQDGDPALRAGASIGRGVTVMGQSGWIVGQLSTTATLDLIETKAEATLGVTLPTGWKVWSQISVTESMANVFVPTLTPAVPPPGDIRAGVSAAVPVRDGLWVNLGVSQGLTASGSTKIKLGLWAEF